MPLFVDDFTFKAGHDVFTPKDLIELARPGVSVANLVGDLILTPVSKYSFDSKTNEKSIYVTTLNVNTEPIQFPFAKGGDAFWLDTRTIGHVVEGEKAKTLDLFALSVEIETQGSRNNLTKPHPPVFVGTIPTDSATNFVYNSESGRLIFSDMVYADGDLYTVNEQDEAWKFENRETTALVYEETFIRQWDHWILPKSASLFSVKLRKEGDKWNLSRDFKNLLKNTKLKSPVEPFGGTQNFAVSSKYVVFTAKDPNLPPAWHTKQNIYIVNIDGTSSPKALTFGAHGATANPVIDVLSEKIAWLQMDKDGYESDRNQIVIYDLTTEIKFKLTPTWDRSPESLSFSEDGQTLYLTAGDSAKVKIFAIAVPPTPGSSSNSSVHRYKAPTVLTHSGAALGLQPLRGGRLLFSRSSLVSPNDAFLLNDLRLFEKSLALQSQEVQELSELSDSPLQLTSFSQDDLKAKDLDVGEEIWFKGAEEKDIQGWILKPKGWKKADIKKWPAVLLIHGGPQGAWEDQWSTRWNPNIFAQQGYFTVAINPTGSTTFGQNLTDGIAGDWGGKPFVDLAAGWKYVLNKYPQIDQDRLVGAGASWGGYAINWIQGHPEYEFNFKAVVCHDGLFDAAYNGFSTDELFFFNHEWEGRPWDVRTKAILAKFNPANFVDKWAIPQLTVHSSKDFRVPETEGIAAFQTLQQLGIPSRLLIFPDENHWVLKHGNSLKWHYEVFRWFEKFVGDRA